ncbi:MAG: transcriptional regulator NrdR [Alphaproteobacteria bacterium]|nr:transcriptional regulator NrdR [Alphaproteobacteria bacterium]
MRCPFCADENTQVRDSRPVLMASSIRRKRFCPKCEGKFLTFERVQINPIIIIKRDGRKQPYDRDKIMASLRVALRKRPFSDEKLELAVSNLTRRLENGDDANANADDGNAGGANAISSEKLGLLVLEMLRQFDEVAYVRFASVYLNFHQAKSFADFISGQEGLDES